MKRTLAVLTLGMSQLWLTSCSPTAPVPSSDAKSASTESVERALTQMERDWADAIVKHDAATISTIVAEDWSETSWDGTSFGKAQALAELPMGSTESITMDPIKVRVFGQVAIVTAGDVEKSTYKGKDTSGHYVWTDVYMNREGRWQVVATQGSKVPALIQSAGSRKIRAALALECSFPARRVSLTVKRDLPTLRQRSAETV